MPPNSKTCELPNAHCIHSLLAVDSTDERCCLLVEQDILLDGLMLITVLRDRRLAVVAHGGLVLAAAG